MDYIYSAGLACTDFGSKILQTSAQIARAQCYLVHKSLGGALVI